MAPCRPPRRVQSQTSTRFDNATASIYRTASGAGLNIDDSRLVAHLVVLGLSAAATLYLLFFNPATRVWRDSQAPT